MKKTKNYWLLKSEPTAYSIDDLARDKKTMWNGVRNYQARNFIRDMKKGDEFLFYHSGDEKSVAGIGKVMSEPYADETQFDKKDKRYDPKSSRENPMWSLVDVAFGKKFKRMVTLAEIKNDPALNSLLLRQATRLSIQPVSEKHFKYIVSLGK